MQLPKLTLVPPKIQSGDLFPALELVMSSTTFKEAISFAASQAGRGNKKSRKKKTDSPNLRYRSFSNCDESLVC